MLIKNDEDRPDIATCEENAPGMKLNKLFLLETKLHVSIVSQ